MPVEIEDFNISGGGLRPAGPQSRPPFLPVLGDFAPVDRRTYTLLDSRRRTVQALAGKGKPLPRQTHLQPSRRAVSRAYYTPEGDSSYFGHYNTPGSYPGYKLRARKGLLRAVRTAIGPGVRPPTAPLGARFVRGGLAPTPHPQPGVRAGYPRAGYVPPRRACAHRPGDMGIYGGYVYKCVVCRLFIYRGGYFHILLCVIQL